MVNKTHLGWDSLSHHCRNLSNRTYNYLIKRFTCVVRCSIGRCDESSVPVETLKLLLECSTGRWGTSCQARGSLIYENKVNG